MPVASYPYARDDRLNAVQLDKDLEFSPGANPPKSRLGVGAGRFKFWMDTSGALPVLRQCVVTTASASYVAADWIAWGVVDAPNHKFHFDPAFVDFAGGSGGSFPINGVIQATGPTGGLAFNDQTVGGQNWIWYATGGQAYLDSGSAHRITVNFSRGDMNVAGNLYAGSLTSQGNQAAVFMADRANPTTVTWGWYASGNVMNLWRNDGSIPFRVEASGNAWIAGNQIIRAGDGATQFQSNLNVSNDLHVFGNAYAHNQLLVTNQATIGGSVVVGGDLYLNRTSDPWGYILRPNIAGYSNLRFSTASVTYLAQVDALTSNFYINSNGGYPLYMHANTGSVRLWTVRDGVRAWSTGTLDNGTYQIADESAGLGRLIIDTNGTTTLHGSTAWPLVSDSPSSYCMHLQTATGVRAWSSGAYNSGSYVIRDETAGGVVRFDIDTSGQAHFYGGQVYAMGTNAIYWFQDRTLGSYWGWLAYNGTAYLYWTGYGERFSFTRDGDFITAGNVYTGGLHTIGMDGAQSIGLYRVGDGAYLYFYPGISLGWEHWTGNLVYYNSNGYHVIMRASDGLVFNNQGPMAGMGDYQNLSDRRFKTAIEPTARGLTEILQLQPVEFERIKPALIEGERPLEIGFVAQDVAPVLPEAVWVAGVELPDGTGGLSTSDPTLAISSATIVACLVNAVKTLDQRLRSLEGV